MKTLTIPLKREYFEQIKRGEKFEEYWIATPYWRPRLAGREYDQIVLTLARGDGSRRLLFPWRGARLTTITHPHFGPYSVQVFAIALSDQIGGA
jgi:hypothetical protein